MTDLTPLNVFILPFSQSNKRHVKNLRTVLLITTYGRITSLTLLQTEARGTLRLELLIQPNIRLKVTHVVEIQTLYLEVQ